MSSELEIRIRLAQQQALREGQELANKLGGILRGVKGDVSIKSNDSEIRKAEAAIKSLQSQAQQAAAQSQKLKAALNLSDDEVRKVTAEMKRLEGAAGKAGKEVSLIPGFLQSFAGNLAANAVQSLTQALLGLGSAAAQSVQQALGAFGEFDQAKQAAATISTDIEGLVSRLKDAGKELGGQKSTTELLRASYQALSAGITDTAAAAEIAKQGARGALADPDGADTIEVVKALTKVYNAYGLQVEDVAGLTDKIVKVQADGVITVGQYAEGVGEVAGIAQVAGVRLDELNSVIAVSTRTQGQAEAFVGLRSAINNLLTPSAEGEKILKKYGITSAAATLQAEGLAGVLDRIKGASAIELKEIFADTQGFATITTVAGENLGAFNEALANQGKAAGSADAAIKVLVGSFASVGARLEVLRNEIDVAFGASLAPLFGGFEDLIGDVVGAIDGVSLDPLTEASTRLGQVLSENPKLVEALATGIEKLSNAVIGELSDVFYALADLAQNEDSIKGVQNAIEDLAGTVELLGRFAEGIVGIITVLTALNQETEILPGAEVSLTDLLTPFGLVTTAIDLLSAAIASANDGFDDFRARYPKLVEAVIDSIPGLRQAVELYDRLRGSTEGGKPVAFKTAQGAGTGTLAASVSGAFGAAVGAAQKVDRPAQARPGQGPSATAPTPPDLKELAKTQDNALAAIEAQGTLKEAQLRQQGASDEALAQNEQAILQKRITAQQAFVAKLQKSGLSGVEFDKELLDAQKGLADDQIKLADAKADAIAEAEQRAADARQASRDDALNAIDLAQTQATRDQVASGAGQEEIAAAEQRFLQQRVAALREFANEQRAAGVSPQEQIQADKAVADAELALARNVADQRAKIDRERLDKLQAEQAKAFERQQRDESDAFDKQAQGRQKAFQKELQGDQEAFNERQRALEKAFQKQQQDAQEAFNKRQQEERDRAGREFDVLTSEVDRRVQLAGADKGQRKELQAQFAEEDRQAQQRRAIEAQVLNERGGILAKADQQGALDLSPIEQARADFEARLQEEAKLFSEAQQAEQEAFAEANREANKAFDEAQQLQQEAFAEAERDRQRAFQDEQQAAQEAFAEQQRELDKASAREIAAILANAPTTGSAIPARRLGGPVDAGQLYQVGESGPELFRTGAGMSLLGADGPELFRPGAHGQILSAEQTAAMLGRSAVADLDLPIGGGMPSHRLESQIGRLVAALGQQQPGGDSITFINEPDPYGSLEKLQAAKLRQLVRARR